MSGFSETVEIHGHIIDSLILPRLLDEVVDSGADYEVLHFEIGKTHEDPSVARIKIWAPQQEILERALHQIHPFGAVPVDMGEAVLAACDLDGAFPATFYSTTNLPTEIRVEGRWIQVENPEMDCGIVLDGGHARTIPVSDVTKGQLVVTGRTGVRVSPIERPRGQQDFEFMASTVSSEKPKELQVNLVAKEMRQVRSRGLKILWVLGPAVIHTGSGPELARMVADGWVDVVFAGNGFATHDLESNLFKTSLGIHLDQGISAEGGHEHHIRAINLVRRSGSIGKAIEDGVITAGVMYELLKHNVPFVLGGSVRDDGPLPDTITDVIEAQRRMREQIDNVGLAIMVASMLHGIATGNILPASVPIVCVDINPSTVTKLLDRGSHQSIGIVTDVGLFIKELNDALRS